jgi:hypothetical protein
MAQGTQAPHAPDDQLVHPWLPARLSSGPLELCLGVRLTNIIGFILDKTVQYSCGV